jgi:hypothetical protein
VPYDIVPEPKGLGPHPDLRLRVGSTWAPTDQEGFADDATDLRTIIVRDTPITVPKASSEFLSIIEEHRIRQSIEQQGDFLEKLREDLHKAKRDADRDRNACVKVAVAWGRRLMTQGSRQILDPEEPNLAELLDAVVDISSLLPGEAGPQGREPYEFRSQPRSFRRYLAQAFPGEFSYQQMALRRILQPSLVQQLSEYFETGPVKVLTHLGHLPEYWRGTLDLFNASFDDETRYFRSLAAEITQRLDAVCATARETFITYDSAVVNYWNDVRGTICTEDQLADTLAEDLAARRDQVLSFQVPGFAGNRWFLLTPQTLMSPFVAAYNRKEPGSKETWSEPLLIDYVTPRSPYLGTALVCAVEHYCFFPYTIHNKVEWSTSEIWKAWNEHSRGCEIGELYYFDGQTAFLLLSESRENVGLIYVPILEMQLRFAATGLTSPALVTVFRHWRMRQVNQGVAGEA